MVVKATEQGAELTRRLLSFGRRQMLTPVVMNLGAVALDLETILARTLGEHLAVAIKPAPDLWNVKADRSQFETAVINLAVNARDAMPEGGNLTIAMSNRTFGKTAAATLDGVAPGDYVAIAVSDDGCGMPPDVLERAFEPFFTTKPEGRGTGLGLAMVYGFAKQSGGWATIESAPGEGTCITIYLPRSTETAAVPAPTSEVKKPVGGRERILLVEDDDMVRDFVSVALSRLGYEAVAVPSGPAALAHLVDSTATFDLLLSDLMLPDGMNGRELAEIAMRLRPALRVLFASGYTEDTLIRDGRMEPGQLLIAKPFDSPELARKIRQALEG